MTTPAPTHETHTLAELETALAALETEQAQLTRTHGTKIPDGPTHPDYKGPQPGSTIDNVSEMRRVRVALYDLDYEIRCAAALARSGFAIGDRVKVGPPRDSRSPDGFGVDYLTSRTGTVQRITSTGSDLALAFTDGRDPDYAPTTRCVKV